MVGKVQKVIPDSPRAHRHRRQSVLQTFAGTGGLGDPATTDVLMIAAAIWWKWWAAVNAPHLLSSSGHNRQMIDSGSIWARAENAAVARVDLAEEARLHRKWAGSHVKILDSILVKDFSIASFALETEGNDKKLALERTRQSLREALKWVASAKKLWGT
ncbi:MAG TPA: hypothetical protein VIJ52_05410 [Pseudolabrys sp.]|nr:hypothetical protein [Pseudolabrys sp.]